MHARGAGEVLRGLARRYAELLRSHLESRLVSVVLFGSVARGDASLTSDIDLLIVAEGLPRGQFARKRPLEPADAVFAADVERAAAVRHGTVWYWDIKPDFKPGDVIEL